MGAINIVLDEKDPQSPIFVEIEDDTGKSIRVGERFDRDDGLTNIRITVEDLEDEHFGND